MSPLLISIQLYLKAKDYRVMRSHHRWHPSTWWCSNPLVLGSHHYIIERRHCWSVVVPIMSQIPEWSKLGYSERISNPLHVRHPASDHTHRTQPSFWSQPHTYEVLWLHLPRLWRYCGDNLSTDRRTDSQTDINTCQSTQNHLSGSFHHRTSLECPGFVSELYLLHVITISSFTVHHRNNQIILRPIKDNSCSRCYMLGASVWWFVISSAGEEIAS